MSPIAAVLIGHLIGDWVVQTDWQADNKMTSWKAMQQHMLGYHLTLGWCLALAGLAGTWQFAAVLIVSWLTHMVIDRRWPIIRLMQATGSAPFSQSSWGPLVVDQAVHISILLVLVGWQ